MRAARWWLLLALQGAVLLVAGCGFALRSWEMDDSVGSVFIAGASAQSDIGSDLRAAFTQAGVETAERSTAADLVVTLLDQRRERRSVSVTGQARAAEYELSRSVQYQVERSGADGAEILIEPRWIRVERVFRVDRNNIVGSNEEQSLVERELKNDMIQQVIRSINLVLTQSAAQPQAGVTGNR